MVGMFVRQLGSRLLHTASLEDRGGVQVHQGAPTALRNGMLVCQVLCVWGGCTGFANIRRSIVMPHLGLNGGHGGTSCLKRRAHQWYHLGMNFYCGCCACVLYALVNADCLYLLHEYCCCWIHWFWAKRVPSGTP